MRPVHILVTATAAAALAGAGFAAGAATKSSTIHACAKKRGGALRLASKCSKSERTVTWAITGPRGPAGAKGGDGTNGTNGTNGINGINGLPGATNGVRAFARVEGESGMSLTPDITANQGFASITSPSSGVYCLTPAASTGIDATTAAAVVSANYNGAFVPDNTFAQLSDTVLCAAGAFAVRTTEDNGGNSSAQSTNPNVDFSIIVP